MIFFNEKLFCQTPKISFTISPQIGLLNGKIVENVWNVKTSTTEDTITYYPTTRMSRLDWEIKNACLFGADTDFHFNDKYSFLISFKNGFPKDCGIMEDYDWLNPFTTEWENDPADELTNYSKHTNYMNGFCFGRIFYLDKNNNISLTPRFGFEIEDISFSGIGGWRTYKSENWEKKQFADKKVISYSQSFIAPVLSLNCDFNFLSYFEATLDLSVLWIKLMNCYDMHHERNALFNDRIEKTWKFGTQGSVFYKINQSHKIGFSGWINFIPESYGFTYSSATATTPDPTTMGGTNRFLWGYSFTYVFKF